MEFNTVLIKNKDQYKIVESWYLKWEGYPVLPFEYLPKVTSLTYFAGVPICSASVYQTDSPVCYIENVIANPLSDPQIRDLALDHTIRFIMDHAKGQGFRVWSAHSKIEAIKERSKSFKRKYVEHGHYWMTGEL